MKVILANKFYYPRGGDCIHTIGLKKILESKGHEVALYTMDYPDNLKSEYENYWPSEVLFQFSSPAKLLKALVRPFGVKEVVEGWSKLLADFKPDIIHLHNIHSQLSPIIAEESKKKGIPVVWTLHDYKPICPAYTFSREGGICEECLTDKVSVIRNKCIKRNILASYLGYLESKKWSVDRLMAITDQFVSPSNFLKNKMIEGGFIEDKLTHIYNFMNDEKVEVNTTREDYCIYLGRLSYEKGVDTLLKAVSNSENIKLKIFGDGPLKSTLEKEHDNNSIIEFMGFQDWVVIKNYLSQARCLIVPSEWYENNSLSIIESLTMGTPVLGSDIGGIPEMINSTNGRLFKMGNSEDLFVQLKNMLQIGDWNYSKISLDAKKRYSKTRFYDEIYSLYNQILNTK